MWIWLFYPVQTERQSVQQSKQVHIQMLVLGWILINDIWSMLSSSPIGARHICWPLPSPVWCVHIRTIVIWWEVVPLLTARCVRTSLLLEFVKLHWSFYHQCGFHLIFEQKKSTISFHIHQSVQATYTHVGTWLTRN